MVETYARDMAKVLEDNRDGLVKKIIHGVEERDEENKIFSPYSRQNRLLLSGSIILLVLGLLVLGLFMQRKEPKVVLIPKESPPIILSDKISQAEISGLKKDDIKQAILNKVNNISVKAGGIESIYPVYLGKIMGLRDFLESIDAALVLPEAKEIVSDDFLIGAANIKTASSASLHPEPFLLIKMRSTPDIFPSMRSWEPKMLSDLKGIFGIDTSGDKTYLLAKNFEDGIIENKNARFLYDKDDNIILMYVYAGDNYVVITDSPKPIHEILIRLFAKRTGE